MVRRGSVSTLALSALLCGAALMCSARAIAASADSKPDWRETIRMLAYTHFKQPAWGYSHCVRDYSLAKTLAAADGVTLDDDVVYAAAYLHDMAAFAPWEKAGVDHADAAAAAVSSVLSGTGFPMDKIAAVQGAIRTHMYDRDPQAPEALYLHDADALDWLGAVGVARILALIDPNGGKPTGPEAVAMLEENLAKVPSRVLSPAGRLRVGLRQQELAGFLRALRAETDDLKTL